MDVTDNPVVRALLKEYLQTGQKVVAFLKGMSLIVCCAATRAVLFTYDLAKVPLEWLDHWWGHAFDWVVRHAGDCCFDGAENLLFGDNHANSRSAQDENMSPLDGGLHAAAKAEPSPQAASPSPSCKKRQQQQQQQQQQCSRLSESSAGGAVTRVTSAGQEEQVQRMAAPKTTSTAGEIVHNSLVQRVSRHPASSAVEEDTCYVRRTNQERMLFELNQGEEEEASSFVPLPNARSGAGGPIRWSLAYLRENTGKEGGVIVGGGGFGKVSVVTLKDGGARVAVKAMSRYTASNDSQDEFIDAEIDILMAAGAHPNVVVILGFIRTTYSVYVMMRMAATDLGEVLSKAGSLNEAMAKTCMQQVVSAVEYIHGKGILHRDLKPANMLLTEGGKVQLADFGISTIMPPGETFFSDFVCGTRPYMAPEVVTGEREVDFSLKIDTWGLGIVAYELMHGRTPFQPIGGANGVPEEEAKASANGGRAQAHGIEVPCFDRSDVQELHNIRSAPVIFDDQLVSPDAQDFISKLLERDVDTRLSAPEAAEHRWLGGRDKANEIRAEVAAAVAATEAKVNAVKARLAESKRQEARRRAPAAEVGRWVVSLPAVRKVEAGASALRNRFLKQ